MAPIISTRDVSGDFNSWASVGCFTDSLGLRTLQGGYTTNYDNNTPQTCVQYCFDNGYNYAGLEYHFECFCSNTLLSSATHVDDSFCDATCSGSADRCGGNGYVTVFFSNAEPEPVPVTATTLESHNNFVSQGCHVDVRDNRALTPTHVEGPMTPQACIETCAAAGFVYAGLEYANECYCGSSLNGGELEDTVPSQCNMACEGNSDLLCGGPDRLNLYLYQPPTITATDLGCKVDSVSSRTLTHVMPFDEPVNVDLCIAKCGAQGFNYAGVEFGNECFCSVNIESVASSDACTMPCHGDVFETCGGPDAINVYQISSVLPPPRRK